MREVGFGRDQPLTLATLIYARIRQEIVDGVLEPGGKLHIGSVSARYGVTSTPVREALSQLASEGFVLRREQRGFAVAEASLAELWELTETRCWTEDIALRQAMRHRTRPWEDAIRQALLQLSVTPHSLDETTFKENRARDGVHFAFHAALLATCPSRFLLAFCDHLRDHATRYRRLSQTAVFPNRASDDEHRAIAEAVLSGNADAAVDQLTTHYRRTARIIAGSAADQGPGTAGSDAAGSDAADAGDAAHGRAL